MTKITHQPFNNSERMTYALGNGFSLQSAPERLFGITYAIYRNVNADFDEFLDYGADLEGLNYCFWVLREGEKIGGIILRPNHIEGLFVRPPHAVGCKVLQAVLPLLRSWSNPAENIEAVDVMPHEIEFYERLGFRPHGGRRVYIAPTEIFTIQWDEHHEIVTPRIAHAGAIAALFLEGYRDYPCEWPLSGYTLEDWNKRVDNYLGRTDVPQACHDASTLIYHRMKKCVMGACIVRPSQSTIRPDVQYAKVVDIVVHPEHRRQGLGRKMLRHALSALSGHYAVLKFGVAIGNSAEALYYNSGFLPGIAQWRMVFKTTVPQMPGAGEHHQSPRSL